MKNIAIATAVAGALTAGLIGLAAPATASTGADSVEETVASLEAQGFKVYVDNLGNKPLDQTQVVNIYRANDVIQWTWDRAHEHQVRKVLYTNVFVNVE